MATESYSSLKLPELKRLLKSRKLLCSGPESTLVNRLRDSDWKTWLAANPIFTAFTKFPVEVQTLIWKHSLPGPRVLSVKQCHSQDPLLFEFPKNHHTPNPAALSVCKLSRKVGLARYKKVLGSSVAYGDLEGGDMLYFGPCNDDDCMFGELFYKYDHDADPELEYGPYSEHWEELEQVKHIILHFDLLKEYCSHGRHGRKGPSKLRKELEGFSALVKLSLCRGGNDRYEGPMMYGDDTPGQLVIEDDPMKLKDGEDEEEVWSTLSEEIVEEIAPHFHDRIPSGMDKDNEESNIFHIGIQPVEVDRLEGFELRMRKKSSLMGDYASALY